MLSTSEDYFFPAYDIVCAQTVLKSYNISLGINLDCILSRHTDTTQYEPLREAHAVGLSYCVLCATSVVSRSLLAKMSGRAMKYLCTRFVRAEKL